MLCYNIDHNLSWTVTGKVRPCNWLDTFPPGNSIVEMKSSLAYQQLQKDNCNDIKNPHCQKCWDKELLGQTSKRQSDNRLGLVYSKINPTFLKIDAAIGDRCNAACVICGPNSSTLWQKELYGKILKIQSHNILWNNILSCYKDILQLDFGGGEPWLNDIGQQIELFKMLIDTGVSSNIKLRYNTNGSIYPKQLIEYFDKFRQVEITLSIEDIGPRFEYNRYPLKWNDILNNLLQLIDLEKNNAKIKLTINYTISVFTFLYAQQFEEYSQQLGVPNLNWNILHKPLLYNIKCLPLAYKDKIPKSNIFYKLVATNALEDWDKQFFNKIKQLDDRRGTNFKKTFPELYSLIT